VSPGELKILVGTKFGHQKRVCVLFISFYRLMEILAKLNKAYVFHAILKMLTFDGFQNFKNSFKKNSAPLRIVLQDRNNFERCARRTTNR